MHMQLTKQAMEFLTISTATNTKNFPTQGMHSFVFGEQSLHLGQF